jgi:Uma2 family endonuclease
MNSSMAGHRRSSWVGHGGVGARLIVRIGGHVEATGLGGVYGPDTSFRIGEQERLPDVSFVAAERIPPAGEPEGIWPFAPDLAVEIVSPADLYERVQGKIREYFTAGTRQVWLISPEHHTVNVYLSPTQVTILSDGDELAGGEVLPGFRCRVGDLFRSPARA